MANDFREQVYGLVVRRTGWSQVDTQVESDALTVVWRAVRNPVTDSVWGQVVLLTLRQMREDIDA